MGGSRGRRVLLTDTRVLRLVNDPEAEMKRLGYARHERFAARPVLVAARKVLHRRARDVQIRRQRDVRIVRKMERLATSVLELPPDAVASRRRHVEEFKVLIPSLQDVRGPIGRRAPRWYRRVDSRPVHVMTAVVDVCRRWLYGPPLARYMPPGLGMGGTGRQLRLPAAVVWLVGDVEHSVRRLWATATLRHCAHQTCGRYVKGPTSDFCMVHRPP